MPNYVVFIWVIKMKKIEPKKLKTENHVLVQTEKKQMRL